MQSDQLLEQNKITQNNSFNRIICVKKKLPSPNRILPKTFQSSKRANHYFTNFNRDIYSYSAQLQFLYNQVTNQELIKQELLSYLQKNSQSQSQVINFSLKTFFLNNSKQIKFLSLTAIQNIAQDQFQRIIANNNIDNCCDLLVKSLHRTKFPFINLKKLVKNQEEKIKIKKIMQRQTKDLQFEDNFQSSNLLIVKTIPKCKNTYFMSTRFDFNTLSYGQWFYFKVKRKSFSLIQNQKFKFVICNMTKRSSMLGKSMKISVCRNNIWQKEGLQISYYKSPFKRSERIQNNNNTENFYILQFSLNISPGQQIYISYNQPYTYSRLSQLIDEIGIYFFKEQSQIYPGQIGYKKAHICQTVLKNQIICLSFTKKNNKPIQQKKIIFILARAHPIETAGSFVIQGILKQILKLKKIQKHKDTFNNNFSINQLLQRFVIKIIPMLNPDGVILGNSRCNMNGFDLNRQWKKPKIQSCRQIFYLKSFILKHAGRIQMVIDLHGHSKKKNVFAYGLHDSKNPFATRQFPYILSKISPIDFFFEDCRFTKIERKPQQSQNKYVNIKQGTARITLWKKLNIRNIFTIQNSYCSSAHRQYHYNCTIFNQIGKNILEAMGIFFLQYTYQKVKQHKSKNKSKRNIQINLNFSNQDNKCDDYKSEMEQQAKKIRKMFIDDLKSKKQNITIGLQQIISSESQAQIRQQQFQQEQKCLKQKKIKMMKKAQSNKQFKTRQNNCFQINQKYPNINFNNKHSLTQNKEEKFMSQSELNLVKNIDLDQQDICIRKNIKKEKQFYNKQQFNSNSKSNSLKKAFQANHRTFENERQNRMNTLSIVQIGWTNESQKFVKSSRSVSTQKIRVNLNSLKLQKEKQQKTYQEKQAIQSLISLKQLKQKQFKFMQKQNQKQKLKQKLKFMQKQKFVQKTQIQRKKIYQNINTKKYEQIKQIISKIHRIPFPILKK